jgi:hypothetical protein
MIMLGHTLTGNSDVDWTSAKMKIFNDPRRLQRQFFDITE